MNKTSSSSTTSRINISLPPGKYFFGYPEYVIKDQALWYDILINEEFEEKGFSKVGDLIIYAYPRTNHPHASLIGIISEENVRKYAPKEILDFLDKNNYNELGRWVDFSEEFIVSFDTDKKSDKTFLGHSFGNIVINQTLGIDGWEI